MSLIKLCLITFLCGALRFKRNSAQNLYMGNPFLQDTIPITENRRQVQYSYNPFSSEVIGGVPDTQKIYETIAQRSNLVTTTRPTKQIYSHNPFINTDINALRTTPRTYETTTEINKVQYSQNPFLTKVIGGVPDTHKIYETIAQRSNLVTTTRPTKQIYSHNPFINIDINAAVPITPKIYQTTTEINNLVTTTRVPPRVYETNKRKFDIDVRIGALSYKDVCGRPVTTPLAIGGERVQKGAYPWVAALHHKIWGNRITFKCGATLISDKHVITAAHCVKDKTEKPSDIVLYFGILNIALDYYTIDANKGIMDGKRIYINPNYQETSGRDIAIVELSQPITFTNYIRPICLWSRKKYFPEFSLVVGFTGYVVEWGQNEEGDLNTDGATLVKMPLVAKDTCLRSHPVYSKLVEIDSFCAGNKDGRGPCNGDSGSGLALKLEDDAWYLRGVASTALSDDGKCDLNNYVVFVDTPMYEDWILGIIN